MGVLREKKNTEPKKKFHDNTVIFVMQVFKKYSTADCSASSLLIALKSEKLNINRIFS